MISLVYLFFPESSFLTVLNMKTSVKEHSMVFGKVSLIIALGCISTATAQFIYLNTGAFKFIAGLGLPIDVGMTGGSLSYFTNVQVFYTLPDNISYFEPYQTVQKRSVKETLNRPTLYQAFVKYFERLGFSGGDCVHRVICEVASREINTDENGLLGEVIHILFSPDSEDGLEDYKVAQWHGLYNGSACGVLYKDCYAKENSIFLL